MKILFLTTHAHIPLFNGGSELSTDNLARKCTQLGHQSVVLSGARNKSSLAALKTRFFIKISRRSIFKDKYHGYTVYRCWHPERHVSYVIDKEDPDIIVIQAGKQSQLAEEALKKNKPVIFYLRDISFAFGDQQQDIVEKCIFIANSQFTARVFKERTGKDAVIIRPLVLPDAYRNPGPGNAVLLVNPNHQKGLDIALQLAERCPDIPFIFVEGWGLPLHLESPVRARAQKLKNLTWLPSTNNMKSIYARTKILLAPTGAPYPGEKITMVEAWGRVVTEAHFSAIPVIASNNGGLPESVGPGGILVDVNADITEWEKALRRLWDDPKVYLRYSLSARQYSERDEIKSEALFQAFIKVCEEALSRRPES